MSNLPPEQYFALRKPCADCPFRSDREFHMSASRRADIAGNILAGHDFVCHRTVDYTRQSDDSSPGTGQENSRACAGARATLRNAAANDPHIRPVTTVEQIATRLGFPVPQINDNIPVHPDFNSWISSGHNPENMEDTENTRRKS